MKRTMVAFFLLSCAWAAAGQQNVDVTVRFSSDRILPALPVEFSFVVANRSKQTVIFPMHFVVEVTPAGGEPFLVRWNDSPPARVMSLPAIWNEHTTIGPGETRVIGCCSWPPESLAMNALPLTAPGAYRLRFAFSDALLSVVDRGSSDGDLRTIADIGASSGLLVSNSAALEIIAPRGVDALVWEKIRAASDGRHRWPARDVLWQLSADIWENHRASRYAPWATFALARESASAERVRQLRDEVRDADPQHALVDWYEVLEATLLLAEARNLLSAGAPLHEIMRHVDLAEDRYRETIRTARNETVVMTARAQLEKLADDRVNLPLQFDSMKHSPRRAPLPVKPLVECGKVSENETHVFFAYENPNQYTVMIPIGARNMFEPGDMDRGQPVSFAAGHNGKAFRVKARSGGSLTWQLDGNVLSVDAGKVRRCSDAEP